MSKQIFSKIAKIGEEVRAAQPMKVEFALIDDLDKLSNNVKQIASDHRNDVVQFQEAVQKLAASYKGKTQQSVDLLTAIRNAEKMATDLGVDINLSKYKTVLDDYYKAEQVLSDLLAKAKTL
jgi:cytochrome c551/c552